MMSNKGDNEKRIICPYNAAHVILPHRLQIHLVKCRKNYPDEEKVVCIHNSTHRVPKPELAFHLENCEDRIGLDKFVFAPNNIDPDKFQASVVEVEPTEVWDDDNKESYDPELHCVNNPVLRRKDVLSKAQRRNFRLEERKRMQQFHSNVQPIQNETLSTADFHPRRPNTLSKGVSNKNDLVEDDVSDMLKKIHLGANIATVPTRKNPVNSVEKENKPDDAQSHGDTSEQSYSSWSQKGAIPKKVTRGRGYAFSK